MAAQILLGSDMTRPGAWDWLVGDGDWERLSASLSVDRLGDLRRVRCGFPEARRAELVAGMRRASGFGGRGPLVAVAGAEMSGSAEVCW
jgi:hypothetical protein